MLEGFQTSIVEPSHASIWRFRQVPLLHPYEVFAGSEVDPDVVEGAGRIIFFRLTYPIPCRQSKQWEINIWREHLLFSCKSAEEVTIDREEALGTRD